MFTIASFFANHIVQNHSACKDSFNKRETFSIINTLPCQWSLITIRENLPFHPRLYTPSQRGNYHHSMFHNPTAAVNLFHVGKQHLTFCKAEAAVTHNLIGRKIISNVKHSDARNSLPILDVIRSSDKRHSTANERYVKRQVSVIRVYTCSERHLTFRRNIDTRRQWSVGNIE